MHTTVLLLSRSVFGAWLAICLGVLFACTALAQSAPGAADTDTSAPRVRLRQPPTLSVAEKTYVRSLPPLRVLPLLRAPPLSRYDTATGTVHGVAIDIFGFIADQIGLSYEFVIRPDWTAREVFASVPRGEVDVLLSMSFLEERARYGVFSYPFYTSHYVAAAKTARRLRVADSGQLGLYRVGVLADTSIIAHLHNLLPAEQIRDYPNIDTLSQALEDDAIDLVVYPEAGFTEERYRLERFDLETVHSFSDFPRQYSFFWGRTEQNQRLAEIFDRYLMLLDTSASINFHVRGEQDLVRRYLEKKEQNRLLLLLSGGSFALLLIGYIVLRICRRRAQRLLAHTRKIQQAHLQLKIANQQLEQISLTDPLTGLYNRRYFDQILQQEYARHQRTGETLSILLLDIDFFKKVNDNYGHAVGDDYLRQVAHVIRQSLLRSSDLAARYGGEEFVCVLPETSQNGALHAAERIRANVERLALPNTLATPPYLTISIGVSAQCVRDSDTGPHELIRQADLQLYRAKRTGRNRVCAAPVSPSGETDEAQSAEQATDPLPGI